MSLSTRLAIGPSRCLAWAEASIIAGALVVTATTASARLAPDAMWSVAGFSAALAIVLGARRWIKQVGSRKYEVFISERTGVSVRHGGEDTMPHSFELTEAAMVWPSFVVLSMRRTHRPGLRRLTLHIPVVRAELDAGEAWQLHRFMLWAQRGGLQAGGSIPKDFLG